MTLAFGHQRMRDLFRIVPVLVTVLLITCAWSVPVAAQAAFRQAVAEAAAEDRDVAAFYQAQAYGAVWTGAGEEHLARRKALMQVLARASVHGLPTQRYDVDELMAKMARARSQRDLGQVEVALTQAYLRYARDVQTGVLVPSKVDNDIKREVAQRDVATIMADIVADDPVRVMRDLPPRSNEYSRLLKQKLRLEQLILEGGWGPTVAAPKLQPGDTGPAVITLRDRLIAMGYLTRSAAQGYDMRLQQAVQAFQSDHGLEADGLAGTTTLAALNMPATERLKSVIVAMERERWLSTERGARHILVNLTDFSARIVDNDAVTFATRAVIGKNDASRRSPEFSDEMEYMVINPTWHVPYSIAVKEYLPQMQRNPGAASHMKLYNRNGREVSRGSVNFSAYNARNFPFAIKQPPSERNALGLVKFMFPNKYNIYLHDTPQKALFDQEKRDFSHGCIRLHQPFDFAYALLARQESDPKGYFESVLNTRRETYVQLEQHVPVHIIYRTAFTQAQGRMQYRGDVYGRDAGIWDALEKAGVSLDAPQG